MLVHDNIQSAIKIASEAHFIRFKTCTLVEHTGLCGKRRSLDLSQILLEIISADVGNPDKTHENPVENLILSQFCVIILKNFKEFCLLAF